MSCLPETILVFTCCPNIIINTTSVYSQECSDLANKFYGCPSYATSEMIEEVMEVNHLVKGISQ